MCGRCKSCNTVLHDEEMTAKYKDTNEYIELCFKCLNIAENPDDDYTAYSADWVEDED